MNSVVALPLRNTVRQRMLSARMVFALIIVTLMTVFGAAGSTAHASSHTPPQRDIVDTAVSAGQFTTLARALQAAGLVDTLKGPGPFTVFAPTDAAFAKLPEGTLNALLQDPARLRAVLTYHVVPGRVTASAVTQLSSATTVQGEPVRIAVSGGTVRLNGTSTVAQADIMASNGVIHVIDTVLLPPSTLGLPSTGSAAVASAAAEGGRGMSLALIVAIASGTFILAALILRPTFGAFLTRSR
jgi:uncharacterized surface protein with fasciclin (FAS1) repeats